MKTPNLGNIDAAKKIRAELTWIYVDEVLYREFARLKENTIPRDVAYKTIMVDSLYNCNLKMDTWEVATKIIGAKVDAKFDSVEPATLVGEVANIEVQKVGKRRRTKLGPVFSSKFCHFHCPKRFAIYDQFADKALGNLLGRQAKFSYAEFKSSLDKLILETNLPFKAPYKEIDEYLWLYGQWLDYKDGRHVSTEIKEAISRRPELFSRLYPT